MERQNSLPDIQRIGFSAPIAWLAAAWRDLWSAPATFLTDGFAVAFLGGAISPGLLVSGLALWAIGLAAGLVFIAPMIAMGVDEGGRLIGIGKKPTFGRIAVVRSALRSDGVLLGLALFPVFGIWIVIPWLGLASWRAFRGLVAQRTPQNTP